MLAIEIEKLVKQYKNGVRALDNLSLKVNRGEMFSLLGPNGAGKSSLINILTTYYKPTSGNIAILGRDLCKVPAWVRTQITCVAQHISSAFFMSGLTYSISLFLPNEVIYETIMNAIVLPIFFLSPALFPFESLSGGLKIAVMLNPFTHIINALRRLIFRETILFGDILPVIALFAVYNNESRLCSGL